MNSPNYQTQNYTKEDIKYLLLNEYKEVEDKTKLNNIINEILKQNKHLYKNCSKEHYSIFIHTVFKKKLDERINISYKHSKYHYTNFI